MLTKAKLTKLIKFRLALFTGLHSIHKQMNAGLCGGFTADLFEAFIFLLTSCITLFFFLNPVPPVNLQYTADLGCMYDRGHKGVNVKRSFFYNKTSSLSSRPFLGGA